MKKTIGYVWRISAAVASLICLALFCGCSPSQPEKADLKTSLSVSPAFAGTRTFTVTYPQSLVAPGSEKAETLDKLITDNCPDTLVFSKDPSSDKVAYTFTLSFTSFSDYTNKLTDILGTRPGITFANPDNALTSGWRIEEPFQSCQLLEWINTAAHAQQNSDFDFESEESSTSVTFGTDTVNTNPAVSVKKLSGLPIKNIRVTTVNKNKSFDRTIVFTITQNAFDSAGNKVSEYFKSVTDSNAEADWSLENGNYSYKAAFTNLTMKEMEGYTNRLLSSVYGDIEYTDKASCSDPLSYQNSYTETIDLSNYVSEGNSDVPLEYIYSSTNGSQLDNCRIYRNFEWENADKLTTENNPGKVVGISETVPTLTLQINDGKQYVPQNIDIALTPLDQDQIQKTFSFRYEISEGGYEASNYTASYFRGKGIPADELSEDKLAVCTVTFSGTPAELNSKVTDIFGDNNLITLSSNVPAMTLRTTKHIEDTVDLSSILVGKNIETPVTYTVKPRSGEYTKYLNLTVSAQSETKYSDKNDKGEYSISLGGTKGLVKTDVSAANISDIIIFCTVSLIILLVALGIIIFLLNRRAVPPPHPVIEGVHQTKLGGGGNDPALPEKKTILKKEKK